MTQLCQFKPFFFEKNHLIWEKGHQEITLISSEIWSSDEVCRHSTGSNQWMVAGPAAEAILQYVHTKVEVSLESWRLKTRGVGIIREGQEEKGWRAGVEGTMDKERANRRNRCPFTPPAVTRVECRAKASKTVVCCLLPVSSSTPNPQEGRYPVSFEHHHKL